MKTIRVVAADDSAVMRSLLMRMFITEHAGKQVCMELVAAVPDGASCLHAVRTLRPDVVLMDLQMPGLGGLDAILRLRREWPHLPIIMCSAYTEDGAASTVEALARGASDYVTKPSGQVDAEAAMALLWTQLAPRILALAGPFAKRAGEYAAPRDVVRSAADAVPSRSLVEIVGIGVSTGGPMALERLLPRLPQDFAVPVVVVQHMPKLFTSALAERLDHCCALRVKQATAGTTLRPGTIWLAPGDSHMEVKAAQHGPAQIVLHQGEPLHHCRPAVDLLFQSMAQTFGQRALGLVLTGMGADGLAGSRAIVAAGGVVLAQDEASSAVWGMPGRVVAAGLARAVLPLEKMGDELIAFTARADVAASVAMRSKMLQQEAARGI